MTTPQRTDVLVVGAGPAGSAAAAWAARLGADVVLADAAVFPRDKTCGDGLTPRAIGELDRLGLTDWVRAHTVNQGLRAHGFGQTLHLPWPGGTLPDWGSAIARTELDDYLRTTAIKAGATGIDGARAVDVRMDGGRVAAVVFAAAVSSSQARASTTETRVSRSSASGWWSPTASDRRSARCSAASGTATRSTASRGVATSRRPSRTTRGSARTWSCAARTARSCPATAGSSRSAPTPAASTSASAPWPPRKRPADVAIKPLMGFYADERREEFELGDELRMPTSALLPMGGAVSNVAGPNWALIGDAAACVNPLNGEGIDYGLETGRHGRRADDRAAAERSRHHLAGGAPRALRRVVLDRTPARRPGDRAPAAAGARSGRHAVGPADDARAALDGQPRDRRGPRPGGPGVALGRAAARSPETPAPRSPSL